MPGESAFDKRLAPETTMDKVEGILEHFNLPPKAIQFIRANGKAIVVGLSAFFVGVVAWSLYDSYRQNVIENAASALTKAIEQPDAEKAKSLEKVIVDYGTTSSALWAKVELAHMAMTNGKYADASAKYERVLKETKETNPAYPLAMYGYAQSLEADKKFVEALGQYEKLSALKGYEHIGYTGMARIEEVQGHLDKATAVLNNYLLTLGTDQEKSKAKEEIESKIAQLKARK
jgi:predicted negative regulator of RcsB-dependent stress response